MEMIIAILIWMGALTADSQYTQEEFDRLVHENHATIDQVMTDPVQQQEVWSYSNETVPTVIIGEGE